MSRILMFRKKVRVTSGIIRWAARWSYVLIFAVLAQVVAGHIFAADTDTGMVNGPLAAAGAPTSG